MRLAAIGLIYLLAAFLFGAGPREATTLAFGYVMGLLADVLVEWHPARQA